MIFVPTIITTFLIFFLTKQILFEFNPKFFEICFTFKKYIQNNSKLKGEGGGKFYKLSSC
jgi:hypothetical protein